MSAERWPLAPAGLRLGEEEVHVWRASLDLPFAVRQEFQATLSADELERAGRYYFEKDRRHFIAARGLLRRLIGGYTQTPPGEVGFSYSGYGKPMLQSPAGAARLRFNVAHSHGLALLALTLGREIGVDLERIRPEVANEEIAERFFAAAEVRALRSLPRADQPQAFFDCWARKEALLKAHGQGLSMPLDQFVVSLAPGEPAALLEVGFDPTAVHRWRLEALDAAPGYAAAVAVEGRRWDLKCWRWE